jgi:portal protein
VDELKRARIRERTVEKSPDDVILEEAYERFKRINDFESDFRQLYIQDIKFANADSDNGWQWPEELRRNRELNKRPALTINKTAAHIALVTNDQRQNKPSISIKPTGAQASFEAAQIYEGIVRNIEYVSNAQAIYDEACESQVEGGIGYWRVITDYIDDESFDQDLRIAPVQDHLGVALDSDIKQKDGSDAKYGFIFDEMPRSQFEREYPDAPTVTSNEGLDAGTDWVRDDSVRLAEYYRIVETKDELIQVEDKQGHITTFFKSEMPKGMTLDDPDLKIKKRKVKKPQLQWFKIAGYEILDRRLDLPGKYIPIVRVVGKERIIEGKLERKGLTRALKDPQRMYNYNSSGQVEYGALATKSPWVGPAAAFEGNENAWKNSNVNNAAYLTYKHRDDEGDIPAPTRPEPPGASPAFVTGMQIAEREMEMTSGQYAAQQGQPSNEKSGVAITARQRQGDTATYHFIDNLSLAIRYTGKILIDLIPKIYDTKRVIKILGRDGTQTEIQVDPQAQQAMVEKVENDVQQVLFNPAVGKYEVASDVGPNFATQRQEAWNAFVQIVTGNPQLVDEIGDLMFQSADFPLADKIAERMRRKIKATAPWLLDDQAPTPKQQMMEQQIQQASQMISELLEKLGDQERKLRDQAADIQIKQQDSISKRITAVSNAEPELARTGDTPQLKQMIDETVKTALENPPVVGAQKAEDGNWYLQHPETGQHMQVTDAQSLG